jgi:flagellar biosynthesis/type III secretory pathway protein FliH
MRKHNIKFDVPPKSVTLIPTLRRQNPTAEMPAVAVESNQKLAATDSQDVAKSDDSQAEVQKMVLKISREIEELKRHHDETLPQIQEFAIRLAMRIARAVVMHDVTHHDDRIRAILDTYLRQHEPQHPVVVYVNKLEMDRLLNSLPDSPSSDSAFQFKTDEAIAPGDCRIESLNQSVIASCDRQLEEIQLQLMENLDNARSERKNSAQID